MSRWLIVPVLVLLVACGDGEPSLATARIAVAANVAATAEALIERFAADGGGRIELVVGSTGQLHAQICQGAPFDAFLAADAERPTDLEQRGLILPGSRFTYAVGRLVLWSARPGLVDAEGAVLTRPEAFDRLAIAEPESAPYGRAAREFLQARGLWEGLQSRLVTGQSAAQVQQFVASGNAELGFVAASQARGAGGSSWAVPAESHAPLAQQAVLLREQATARAFLAFLRGDPAARALLAAHGYRPGGG